MANVKKIRNKPLTIVVVIIILIVASLLGIDVSDFFQTQEVEGDFVVTMIDVGQADSFLLEQDGKTALIDCGTASAGDDVVEYLKQKGITRLDYVIGTHPHDDHMGGMYKVLTNFEIGTIIIPEVTKTQITTAWYAKLMKEIRKGTSSKEARYKLDYPNVGEIYTLGDAKLEVLGPIEEPSNNINNYSIILKVSFGTTDIIMTGDAEENLEKDILESGVNLDAEILKVGHHGSDTSTCDEFLDAVDPEYALISAGFANKHEHPIKSTMENLKKRDISVYRTDECGTVVLRITNDSVEFNTKPGDYKSGTELEVSK